MATNKLVISGTTLLMVNFFLLIHLRYWAYRKLISVLHDIGSFPNGRTDYILTQYLYDTYLSPVLYLCWLLFLYSQIITVYCIFDLIRKRTVKPTVTDSQVGKGIDD